MGIRISMIFIWILWQCFHLHLCCKFHELEYDLEVKNLTLRIRNKEAFLTLDCNVPMENLSDISYEIFLKYQDWEYVGEVPANKCGKEVTLTLPNDTPNPVCVQVVPTLKDEKCQNTFKICLNSEKNEMTENIQCIVYNVSSMQCIWTFGKNTPYNTEYTLSLTQDTTIINCQQYINDLEMRTGSCSFHDLTIHYFEDATIILMRKGSEGHVLKDKFIPAEKEIFSPPTNLTLEYHNESCILSWKGPHTQYPVSASCFQYQMEKNKELISNINYPQHMSNLEKKCLIRIRARGEENCRMNTNWGQWSDEISCDAPEEQSDKTEFIILIILLGLSCFIILLTTTITILYKRVSKLFFPRIPQPKIYFDEMQDYKTNTKVDLRSTALSTSETEECISLQENYP